MHSRTEQRRRRETLPPDEFCPELPAEHRRWLGDLYHRLKALVTPPTGEPTLDQIRQEFEQKYDLGRRIEEVAGKPGRDTFAVPLLGGDVALVTVKRLDRRSPEARAWLAPALRKTPERGIVTPGPAIAEVPATRFDAETTPPAPGMDPETLALERELLARGMQGQLELLSRPEMLTLPQASEHSGIPVRTLTHMRQTGRLLALSRGGALKGYRLPAWQFEHRIMSALPQILAVFGPDRMWQAYDFLTHTEPMLEGKVPLDELRAGRLDDVLRVAPAAARLEQGAY